MKMDKITIQAIVSADIEKVWDYYTRPEHITKWKRSKGYFQQRR